LPRIEQINRNKSPNPPNLRLFCGDVVYVKTKKNFEIKQPVGWFLPEQTTEKLRFGFQTVFCGLLIYVIGKKYLEIARDNFGRLHNA
jgi:hypothetical protein